MQRVSNMIISRVQKRDARILESVPVTAADDWQHTSIGQEKAKPGVTKEQ